jgi:hypothetical protein
LALKGLVVLMRLKHQFGPSACVNLFAGRGVAQVPAGATTGLITITTPAGTATAKHNFVITT